MGVVHRFRNCGFLFIVPFLTLSEAPQGAITADQARIAIESFNTTYWRAGNKTYYKFDNKTGELDYWMWAHAWETEMDAYERTKDPAYLQLIRDCYDGFVAKFGTDLKDRDYNDDIGWWVMAATRAYDLTGVVAYRDLAKKNFDWMYANQTDAAYGGGIWWMNTNKRQKNSASTLPFSVAGFKLARQLGDPSYGEKAKALHAWTRLKLFRTYGEVADRIETVNGVETVIWGPLSYNHGTWISSAWEMFKLTKDSTHFKDAINTLEYFKNILSNKTTGILPDERGDGTGNTDNDAGMYKTVFVHYAMRFIMEAKQWQYLPWMNANAESLWKNRRVSSNLMYFAWATPAPTQSGSLGAQMATGGVALLNLLVLAESMQAFYMEGTDTTNALGQGLWNEFTINASGLSDNGNQVAFYATRPNVALSSYRPFPHSFADVRKAPSNFGEYLSGQYADIDPVGRPFVLRMTDTTWAKVILLKKLPDSRYFYRYGVSRVPRNTVLAEIDYPRSTLNKPANVQVLPASTATVQPDLTVSEFKWEAPLANANTLTGYEIYAIDKAKADTTKPANLAGWTLVGATAQTHFTWSRVGDNVDKYLNLVAVYANGKSAPLEGWFSIPNEKKATTDLLSGIPPGFTLTLKGQSLAYTVPRPGHLTLALYDRSGRLLQTLYAGVRTPGAYSLPRSEIKAGAGIHVLRARFDQEERKRLLPIP